MTYASVAEVRSWLGIPTSFDDAEIASVLSSACKAIDQHCGQRFELDGSATARLFHADTWKLCRLDRVRFCVIGSTDGLVIKTDDNDDGTFETTWTVGTDYFTLPLSGVGNDGTTGWPITAIQAVTTSKWFPCPLSGRPGVQVTAKWGWVATPDPIKSAALMLTAAWHQRRATVTGQGGIDGFFASTLVDDPTVSEMLAPYRRRRAAVVA